ncbi:MAG: NAD(+)/NADH kinase [Planctomycetes bacterium]|nr:NAD(+)/NADH kinase [Planctomycetota bacterium]
MSASGRAEPPAVNGFNLVGRETFEQAVERVLVLADPGKTGVSELLDELVPWLTPRVAELELRRDLREFCRQVELAALPLPPRPDVIVVLGGDGSILSAVRAFGADPVPILGINFGRIGFLASVRATQWRGALADVLEGRAVLEPRMRLAGELRVRDAAPAASVALNEVLVQRGAAQGMLTVSLWDGDTWVSDYRADGLIVASPSGSTAHSLAAGGPILAPSMRGLVVTPISPQSLSHRPLVVHPDSRLTVRVEKASGLTTLVVDGHGFYPMHVGDSLLVSRHPVPYPLLARPDSDPYARIRERLGWRGTFEPEAEGDAPHGRHPLVEPGHGEVL